MTKTTASLFFLIAGFVHAALKPNILFLLIDDQGYADVGFTGSKDIKTPNIDALAKSGTILTSHYAQPVCSPTRAAFLTGRYPTSTGVYQVMNSRNTWPLSVEERTLASALRETGYKTAIFGKWHLGQKPGERPLDRGFDHQYGFMGGAIDNFKLTSNKGEGEPGRDWYRDDKPADDKGYSTHLITKEVCRIIDEKSQDKPLFLYVPYGSVHTPLQSPDSYKNAYPKMPAPRKSLAAMTTAMDESIGKIVEALRKKDILENTLIVYASDNGGVSWGAAATNTPFRGGKADIYEGGVRVCAFATWPGKIPAGKKIDAPVHIIDWFPTLIGLAGGSLEQKFPVDGKDIWPVLAEGKESPHDAILMVGSVQGQRAIRMGQWKLLINPWDRKTEGKGRGNSGRIELYNLSNDPAEKNNLAGSEPKRVATMKASLEKMTVNPINPEGFHPAKRRVKKKSK
ncbi:arylsulfatase [Akkermansiaceae bacterium]|nr:arylsulfatase [Akkermansiaceae bacterium]